MSRAHVLNGTLVALVAIALSAPVTAATWVATSDPWFWIDIDSRETKDGVTYFVQAHSAASGLAPDVSGTYSGATPEADHGFNCATSQVFSRTITNAHEWVDDKTGTVEPIYAWLDETSHVQSERIAELKHIICDQ